MNDTSRPCLCVLFNHPFPDNIPILERIHRRRFPVIKYIIPFVHIPSNPDVITVYRGSFTHNAFVTDAYERLKDIDCSHYVFIQDDVLLNPAVNAENLADVLGVGRRDGYISVMQPLDTDVGRSEFFPGVLWRWFYPRNLLSGTGVDAARTILKYLPPIDVAAERMKKYNLPAEARFILTEQTLSASRFHRMEFFGSEDLSLQRQFVDSFLKLLFDSAPDKSTASIPYPLVFTAWAADFYVIPHYALNSFCHISGLLAAIGVFVELAVATAMILSIDNIRSAAENELMLKWGDGTPLDIVATLEQMASTVKFIAAHPAKLSQFAGREDEIDRLFGHV
jgi:hypothetical protein